MLTLTPVAHVAWFCVTWINYWYRFILPSRSNCKERGKASISIGANTMTASIILNPHVTSRGWDSEDKTRGDYRFIPSVATLPCDTQTSKDYYGYIWFYDRLIASTWQPAKRKSNNFTCWLSQCGPHDPHSHLLRMMPSCGSNMQRFSEWMLHVFQSAALAESRLPQEPRWLCCPHISQPSWAARL